MKHLYSCKPSCRRLDHATATLSSYHSRESGFRTASDRHGDIFPSSWHWKAGEDISLDEITLISLCSKLMIISHLQVTSVEVLTFRGWLFCLGLLKHFLPALATCLITSHFNLQQMEWDDKKFNPLFGKQMPKPYDDDKDAGRVNTEDKTKYWFLRIKPSEITLYKTKVVINSHSVNENDIISEKTPAARGWLMAFYFLGTVFCLPSNPAFHNRFCPFLQAQGQDLVRFTFTSRSQL